MKPPVIVSVTGAAGQIGYSLLFRIASGSMLGPDQPVSLRLIEIPSAMTALEGVVMELEDCAFPLVESIVPTSDLDEGFRMMSAVVGVAPEDVVVGARVRLAWREGDAEGDAPVPVFELNGGPT